ncbi:ShET2/EspL2 family type III secretion system effector toxin (plasmid) [Burkholderia sp. M6-3]
MVRFSSKVDSTTPHYAHDAVEPSPSNVSQALSFRQEQRSSAISSELANLPPRSRGPSQIHPVLPQRKELYIGETVKKGPLAGKPRTHDNLNGEVPLSTGQTVVCRHLAYAYLTERNGFLDTHLQTREGIQTFFEGKLDKLDNLIDKITVDESRRQIVDNMGFGPWLADTAQAMLHSGTGEARGLIMTPFHALAVKIVHKPADDKEARLAISFYDPMNTGQHTKIVLSATEDTKSLKTLSLQNCFDQWQRYFDPRQNIDTTTASISLLDDIPLAVPSKLKYWSTGADSLPGAMYLAMRHVLPSVLVALGEEISGYRFDEQQIMLVLDGRGPGGSPAIFPTMKTAHVDLLKAMGVVLERLGLKGDRVAWLIEAKRADGCPALYLANQEGREAHARFAIAVGEVARQLQFSPATTIRLFAAKRPNGVPGLFSAALNGNDNMIMAYAKALKPLGICPTQAIELFAGKDADGVTAPYVAAFKGHAGVFEAYGEAMTTLGIPRDQAVQLLEEKVQGMSPVYVAAVNGHESVINAINKVLSRLGIQGQQAVRILTESGPNGESPRAAAGREGHDRFVKAFDAVLKNYVA